MSRTRGPAVLVTDGGRGQNRSALAAVQGLARAGYDAVVTVSARHSVAAASRGCARQVAVPPVDDAGYRPAVEAELARGGYLTVLPASDAALVALGAPGADLVDKAVLRTRAAVAGLAVPDQEVLPDAGALLAAADRLPYPVVVKAVRKATGRERAAVRADGPSDLPADLHGPVAVQPFSTAPMRSVCGVHWRGRLVAAVHQRHERLWPPVCGDACSAVTTAPDPDLEERLRALLGDYDGIFQAELAGDLLLDLNPRVYGSMPLGAAAGVDLVGTWCALVAGRDVAPVRARAGTRYRWWEGELRHLHARWRAGEVGAAGVLRVLGADALGSRPGRPDVGPVVARLRYASGARR